MALFGHERAILQDVFGALTRRARAAEHRLTLAHAAITLMSDCIKLSNYINLMHPMFRVFSFPQRSQ